MVNKRKLTDHHLLSMLRRKGFITPKTEAEVDAFEQAIKEHDIPPLPAELNDPEAILKKPYSNRSLKLTTEEDSQDAENLARAARDGKTLPQSVLDKMKKDRDDAEHGE